MSYKQYLKNEQGEERGAKPASVIDGIYTQHGTQELVGIFEGKPVLQFPKTVKLLKFIVTFGCENNSADIVLDFFAGSCTTAQAVLELNREDGGNRKFIVVQLPEPTGREDYLTIAEIGKERIRRVIAKLKQEGQSKLDFANGEQSEDLGFRVFKLSQPNIRRWTPESNRDPDAYVEKLSLFNDPLASGWTAANVLWEVALREGYSLNTRFEQKTLDNGNTIYDVSDPDTGQRFAVCLDDEIRAELSKCVELTADRLLVCRDIALDDTAAANLALQCRLKTI